MAVKQISQETVENIEKKTAKSLPDNPSDQGFSPHAIKRRLYAALLDPDNSIISEVNRIVDEINSMANEIMQEMDEIVVSAEEPTDTNIKIWYKVVDGTTAPPLVYDTISGGLFTDSLTNILSGGTFIEEPVDTVSGGSF